MITAESLGMPQEVFEALKNTTVTTRKKTGVKIAGKLVQVFNYGAPDKFGTTRRVAPFYKWMTTAQITPEKTELFGMYALNYVRDLIHENDYAFLGMDENGVISFFKDEITFTQNGVEHRIAPAGVTMFPSANGYIIERSDPETFRIGGVDYTPTQLAEMASMSEDAFLAGIYNRFIGVNVNTSSEMANVFTDITANGDGTYTGKVFVNGVEVSPSNKYGNYKTSYGKSGIGYLTRWKVYNDATKLTADPSAGYEAGNFGCFSIKVNPQYGESAAYAPVFDDTKENAILELQLEELPAQGKNFSVSCYYDLKTGQPIFRLPRQKVS